MSKRRIRSPFAGFPKTREVTQRSGEQCYIITPKTLTPRRAMVADFLGGLTVAVSLYYAVKFVSLATNPPGWALIGAFVLPLCALRLFQSFWRAALKKESHFEIDESVLTQRRFPVSTTYDRKLPHKITLLQHDLTEWEKETQDLAVRQAQSKGKIISKRRYYGESFHLSYEYLGHRNDLLTIFGRKDAIAVAARLKACDDVMNNQARMGDGIALGPEEQWNDEPGDIE